MLVKDIPTEYYERHLVAAGEAGDVEGIKIARRAVNGSKRAQRIVRRWDREAAAQAD